MSLDEEIMMDCEHPWATQDATGPYCAGCGKPWAEVLSHEVVSRKIDAMSAADVKAWLQERNANCHRLAANKTGKDREGWLEDAAYFAAAIGLIDWTVENQ